MAYTVSEESGSVSLVVVKRGSSTSTIAVELSTVNQNAVGKWIYAIICYNPVKFECDKS